MSLFCCLERTIPGQAKAAGFRRKIWKTCAKDIPLFSLLSERDTWFLDVFLLVFWTHISPFLYAKWYLVIVSRKHGLIEMGFFLGSDFTSCECYVAMECFRGKKMTPFSFLLCLRCSPGIAGQLLNFQILIFRLSWSIYRFFFFFFEIKKYTHPSSIPLHTVTEILLQYIFQRLE